ncbi:triphosphoribosyl-dephospho-CoA synthase [Mycobacterium sp. MS1601]|uniref:triphosphoribosyl-dephospho-CoA synthase n=1 Tax=Mycobacterium sp. MS1601 TaxID=1936029 RepID=UPI0009794472|nr:triphosphoribosyl-dephospho-CoA synthase [Mycobacterium sp. MS1601]AQA03213.1 triphosphoribosyl-dephospho-CoA synthase [Mycobacterium sp. MS1601]
MSTAVQTLEALQIADLAVAALHDEVDLTPKPGLVDARGSGAHNDMTAAMLHDSANALHQALLECACAGATLPVGVPLRAQLGEIGRAGEHTMLAATGGVNTHRGALWALGLLSAAAGAGASTAAEAVSVAAELAQIDDPAGGAERSSHGAVAARRFGVHGARGQARDGFPDVIRHGMPALRSGGPLGALLALMARVDDTCLLYRGGAAGLAAVQHGAQRVLAAGGLEHSSGRALFDELDRMCMAKNLSPGGSGDLLAVTLFLDTLERRSC